MATQKNKAAIIAEFIAAIFPNVDQQIDAQVHQDALLNLFQSIPFILDNPEIFVGLTEYVSGNTYNEGDATIFEGRFYQSNEAGVTGPFDDSKWTIIPINDAIAEFTPWDNVTNYVIDNTVRHSNRLWKSTGNNVGQIPPDNPGDWTEVSPAPSVAVVNPYVAGIYKENTIIIFSDKIYHITPLVGNTLDSTDPAAEIITGDWTLLASVGTGLSGMTENVVQKADGTGADLQDSDIFDDGTSVVIGSTSSDGAAILKLDSTTKGFLKPRMDTTARDALSAPPKGLEIYNTTTNQPEVNTGTTGAPIWTSMTVVAAVQTLQSVLDGGSTATVAGAISMESSASSITLLANTEMIIQGLKYPNGDGAAGQAIVTDGAGNLSFAFPGVQDLQSVLAAGSTASLAPGITLESTANNVVVRTDDGSILSEFKTTVLVASMRLNNSTNEKSIVFTGADMIVADSIDSKGLAYQSDYSANFTNNSLITKQWVDDQGFVTSTDGNGIYSSDGNVGAGRIVTLTDTIDFAGGIVGMVALQYVDGNEGAGKVLQSDAGGNATWVTFAGDGDGIYDGTGSLTGSTIIQQAAFDLTFQTDGDANTMKIDATNGRVGINIAAPLVPFHVSGNARIDTTGANGFEVIGTASSAITMWKMSSISAPTGTLTGLDVRLTGVNTVNNSLNLYATGATNNRALNIERGVIHAGHEETRIYLDGSEIVDFAKINVRFTDFGDTEGGYLAIFNGVDKAISYGYKSDATSGQIKAGNQGYGYWANLNIADGTATGFRSFVGKSPGAGTEDWFGVHSIVKVNSGTVEGDMYSGFFETQVSTSDTLDGDANGIFITSSGGASGGVTGTSRGIHIINSWAGTATLGHLIGIEVDVSTNATVTGNQFAALFMGGAVGIGILTPTGVLELGMSTENTAFVDAGSAGATQQDWIEVKVGGNQGYVHVFAGK